MNRIFNMDNGFFRALSKIVDCFALGLIFIITCIPIFTIGASATAMYYTVQKVLRHDRGYVSSAYWHSFKTNFKQATIIWLIVLAFALIMLMDMWIMKSMAAAGNKIGKTYIIFQVMMVFEAVWCIYLFPYMARFKNTTKVMMKNAALIAIMNLPWTLLIVLITAAFIFVLLIIPLTILPLVIIIIPPAYTVVLNLILERIFRKYMSEEDKAAEDEMNREYKN